MVIAECCVCRATYSKGEEFENLCKVNNLVCGDQSDPRLEELLINLQEKKLICTKCGDFEVVFTHNTKLKR